MKPIKNLLDKNGVTLVELLISIVISLLVLAAGTFILLSQSGVFRAQRAISSETQQLNDTFNTVSYSLRMAGFDYGAGLFISSGAIQPVEINSQSAGLPYELLTSYDQPLGSTPNLCTMTPINGQGSANYSLAPTCDISKFYQGQFLNIIGPLDKNGAPYPVPAVRCITQTYPPAQMKVQLNPGADCQGNPVPPQDFSWGYVSIMVQILFYWSNTAYNFNSPFDQPGTLYMCSVNPPVLAGTQPVCEAGTTVPLEDNVTNFSVTPGTLLNNYNQAYEYTLSISGESKAEISPSPNYSVNSPTYNPSGYNSRGYNIIKTLNSVIFSKNIYYGK